MSASKFTEAMREVIRTERESGTSNTEIAAKLNDRFNTAFHRRTIDRFVRKTGIEGPTPKNTPKTPRLGPRQGMSTRAPVAKATRAKKGTITLDENKALKAAAKRLQALVLYGDLTPRDLAALNAELRQTFAAIRSNEPPKPPKFDARAEADADWVVAQLRRLDRLNQSDPEPNVSESEHEPSTASGD